MNNSFELHNYIMLLRRDQRCDFRKNGKSQLIFLHYVHGGLSYDSLLWPPLSDLRLTSRTLTPTRAHSP